MKFSTKAIRSGQEPEAEFGSVIPPIYQTSTYVQKSPGEYNGYDYTRAGNPNFTNLEKTLASLEEASFATVFSSGLGALTGLVSILVAGDKVVAVDDIYGGTYRLFTKIFNKFGINLELIDMQDLDKVEQSLSQKTKMVIIESPTNPLLKVIDIKKVTGLAKKYKVLSVVDNTFASPYFQNPIALGADIVWHSTTKYISGHSDAIGGVIITNDKKIKEQMDFARMALGLNPSPFDTWLTSKSLKTLAVRMDQHQKNAFAVANFFASHPKVKKVYYPGLSSHKNYEVAKTQMKGYSGIVTVDFNLSLNEVKKLISSFKIFLLAESLGGVESLVNHPGIMTHASIPKEEREKKGISDSLVRFSIGIEDTDDLLEDLKATLER